MSYAEGYNADDLKRERVEQIRHAATVQQVNLMFIQEWEVVALCDLALRSMNALDRTSA